MKRILASLVALVAASAAHAGSAGVIGSKHDFSVTGPGSIHAIAERNACVFCHVPHVGTTNRPDPASVHTPYESTTMRARPGAPTRASRICLSCHDGTIAVGETRTGRIETVGGAIPAGSSANLGTDLRRSHPISFVPVPEPEVHAPAGSDAVRLDRTGQLQCTSCHDPHVERGDPTLGKFLVKPVGRSALCLSCHEATTVASAGSSHATTNATFGPQQGNRDLWPSIAEAGCLACHLNHGADSKGQLVARPQGDVDETCLRCHDGSVARKSIARDVSKPAAHARAERGVHDAGEGRRGARVSLPETSAGAPRHVSCVDCHNPHAAADRAALPPAVGGALAGVWGIDESGRRIDQVRFEYEVCFKCHGDSANAPRPNAADGVLRATPDANLRRVFTSGPSAHPVVTPVRSPSVPSLKAPWRTGQLITCGDCHGADDSPSAGGSGNRGPHGSIHPHLLEREYRTAAGTVETAAAYALCYKCHDRDVLLSDGSTSGPSNVLPSDGSTSGPKVSAFPPHARHLTIDGASCATCHDPHGVSPSAGTVTTGAHLISFDLSVVTAKDGVLRYETAGAGAGNCTLTCHGHPHERASYGAGTPAPSVLRAAPARHLPLRR